MPIRVQISPESASHEKFLNGPVRIVLDCLRPGPHHGPGSGRTGIYIIIAIIQYGVTR
ncbi:MAG: hypothetical protein JW860_04320 [Sedimentisphaerales bacterium]|nr:hypothetical protein [Sedimentisphaerales bacterium]